MIHYRIENKNVLNKISKHFYFCKKICIYINFLYNWSRFSFGAMAEWLGRGLQHLVHQFEPGWHLHLKNILRNLGI